MLLENHGIRSLLGEYDIQVLHLACVYMFFLLAFWPYCFMPCIPLYHWKFQQAPKVFKQNFLGALDVGFLFGFFQVFFAFLKDQERSFHEQQQKTYQQLYPKKSFDTRATMFFDTTCASRLHALARWNTASEGMINQLKWLRTIDLHSVT